MGYRGPWEQEYICCCWHWTQSAVGSIIWAVLGKSGPELLQHFCFCNFKFIATAYYKRELRTRQRAVWMCRIFGDKLKAAIARSISNMELQWRHEIRAACHRLKVLVLLTHEVCCDLRLGKDLE